MDRHHAFAMGFGLCAGIFFYLFILYIEIAGDAHVLKHQAVERGYALHCPTDGEFAWKGECEEEQQ